MFTALFRRFADRAARRENELYRHALGKIRDWEVFEDTADTRLIRLYAKASVEQIPFDALDAQP